MQDCLHAVNGGLSGRTVIIGRVTVLRDQVEIYADCRSHHHGLRGCRPPFHADTSVRIVRGRGILNAEGVLAVIDPRALIGVITRSPIWTGRIGRPCALVGGFIAFADRARRVVEPGASDIGSRRTLMFSIARFVAIAKEPVGARGRAGHVGGALHARVKLLAAAAAAYTRNAKTGRANIGLARISADARLAGIGSTHATSTAVDIGIAGESSAGASIARFPAARVCRANIPVIQTPETSFGTSRRRARSTRAASGVASLWTVTEHIIIAELLRVGNVTACVEDATIGGAEFSVIAVRVRQTLDAGVVALVAKAVGPRTCAAGRAGPTGTIACHGAGLSRIPATATHSALCGSQAGCTRHESATARLARYVRWIRARVRSCGTSFLSIAIKVVVTIAVVFALNAQAGKGLAAESPARAIDGRTILTNSATTGFLSIAEQTIVAVLIGSAFDAGSCRRVAGKVRSCRAMRVARAFNARVQRFAALRCRWLATYRVDGASLKGFVTKIITVAIKVVAIGRQTRTARTVSIDGTNLPHARATSANPLAATSRITVVVMALAEDIA